MNVIRRPWGTFEYILPSLTNYQVKRLSVEPGQCTSLQKHQHRCEYWVVVEGSGEAIVGKIRKEIEVGSFIQIPSGTLHRLSNPSTNTSNLSIVEVQLGTYLGEDDIQRLEDAYGRI